MSKVKSRRYGDLRKISNKTDGRCHICHEPVHLAFYGPPGSFGDDTVTVDHVLPQAHGGGDGVENLLLAHAHCNSSRGTRDVEEVRIERTGAEHAPLAVAEKNAISVGVGGLGGYLGGGVLFARRNPDGSRSFNHGAAIVSALACGLLLRAALS